jgi:ATP-dependent helicase/nuclease subunit A
MKLTQQQEKAAYAANSVVVTAGAGTGKTAMLAERFLHHVKADHLRPIEVVAVTFTEKAAAELRQRIRKTLADRITDEDLIAEVDAAQISTIHALAARVCREFYHLVGIGADFRILLETESAIWLADKIDAAMGKVDEGIIAELGYSWLKDAIGQLLLDPYSANLALSRTEDEWRESIAVASADAMAVLINSNAWREAASILTEYRGTSDDRMESYRGAAVSAMSKIEAGDLSNENLNIFRDFRKNLGSAKNWSGGLIEIRQSLSDLRDTFNEWVPLITMEFGPLDLIAIKRIELLRKAFGAVHTYLQEQKKQDMVLDFIDLEIFAREILEHEQARKYYAKRWRAFLVDEFQDTNPLQAEILDKLKGDAKQTIVGDEKQSIYGFRRADIAVFRNVRETVAASGGEAIEMSETFRSHESLAVMVNETFAPVLGELHQALNANRKDSPNREIPLTLAMVPGDVKASPDAIRIVESRYIADEVKRLVNSGVTIFDGESKDLREIEYRDIAILSRTWSAIDVYIDALSAAAIPAVNAGGGSLLDTREAKDAIALISFLSDTTDDISLAAILRSPFFAISDRTLFELAKSKQKDQDWWQIIRKADGDLGRACAVLSDLLEIKNKISPEELLREADARTGYAATIANLPQGNRRETDWLAMLTLMRQLSFNGLGDLFGAVRQIRALAKGRNNIPRPPLDAGNAVTLTSIHNAKGLEWPVVFVPDLSSQIGGWGDKLHVDSDIGVAFEVEDETTKAKPAIYELIKKRIKAREREEEKRLLYVAVTRARDRVILTSGPEKKGTAIELLMPGIEAANVGIVPIPFSDELVIPPTPLEPPPSDLPEFRHPARVKTGLRTIPVTALTEYAVCPLKFRYMYVEGHPGLGEGEARRRTIGTLTHKALQFGIKDFDSLEHIAEDASPEYVHEALTLAEAFRGNEVFTRFQTERLEKEKGFSFEHRGVNLRGSADLVGQNFVLDYKTGEEQAPEAYRFQLWAYAKALDKPQAFVAFLRKPRLYEFSAAESEKVENAADVLIDNIAAGNFAADPSYDKCSKCVYSMICESSSAKKSVPQSAPELGQQLKLFA